MALALPLSSPSSGPGFLINLANIPLLFHRRPWSRQKLVPTQEPRLTSQHKHPCRHRSPTAVYSRNLRTDSQSHRVLRNRHARWTNLGYARASLQHRRASQQKRQIRSSSYHVSADKQQIIVLNSSKTKGICLDLHVVKRADVQIHVPLRKCMHHRYEYWT